MAIPYESDRAIGVLVALFLGVLCFVAAQALANTQNTTGLAIMLGILIAIICFNWPEAGLYILIFSMLLGPEIIVGNLGGRSYAGRGITLRVDDFLLIIIAFSWFARGAVHKELGLLLSTPLNRPIGIYLLAAVVSTAVGMLFDRVRPLVGFFYVLKFVEYIFVYFAAVNFIQDKEHLKRLIYAVIITGILVSLYASLQIPQGVRVSAPFEGEIGEPNTLGGYLLFLLALLGGLLISSPNLRRASRYTAGIILLGIPFLFTLSRASYLGLAAVAACLLIFSRQKIIAFFTVTALALTLFLVAPPQIGERIQFTFGGQREHIGQITVAGVRLDTSTSARLQSYQDILRDFPEHPLLGYGVTGYGFVDAQFAKVLIEMGLLGLVAFLWLVLALFKQGWYAFKSAADWWEQGLCIGFMAGLAGLIFHALGSNTFIIVRIMEPFWFLAGAMTLLHMFNTQAAEMKTEPESEPDTTKKRVSTGLLYPSGGG
jgi:O-antigen ligase